MDEEDNVTVITIIIMYEGREKVKQKELTTLKESIHHTSSSPVLVLSACVMKRFYRKLLPFLMVIVMICLVLNYSINGGRNVKATVPEQANPTTTQHEDATPHTLSLVNRPKEILKKPSVMVEKKKIAYAITITKDGERRCIFICRAITTIFQTTATSYNPTPCYTFLVAGRSLPGWSSGVGSLLLGGTERDWRLHGGAGSFRDTRGGESTGGTGKPRLDHHRARPASYSGRNHESGVCQEGNHAE